MADSELDVAAAQVVAEAEPEPETMTGPEAPNGSGSAVATEEAVAGAGENKRKLEDVGPCDGGEEAPLKKQELSTEVPALATPEPGLGDAEPTEGGFVDVSENVESKMEFTGTIDVNAYDQETQGVGEINSSVAADTDKELQESDTLTAENGKVNPEENVQSVVEPSADLSTTSRKIEVPNNKVGVLIGKAGETIKYLQFNSGAKIQILRDAEADPYCITRPVELIGHLESINKAEKLIKDVIIEADAGGSPSLVARGFGTIQSGREELEIKVPNEKVGIIIGKGGETIKNLQTRSGARIQLMPQHLPDGDESKERSVRITGDKKQIECAKEMIHEVMNQGPRPSPLSGYNHQNYRPHGSTVGLSNWEPRGATEPNMGYNHQQRGSYLPPTSQYPQPYNGYSHQAAPRGGFSGGWDQRSAAGPIHNTPSGGYDYYGQGGPASGNQASMPYSVSGSSLTPANYGQSQAPNYGPPNSYGQPVPPQHNYGQGYIDSRYDSQTPSQQFYSQQTVGPQPGAYGGQGTTPQPGYSQQQSYNKLSSYGMPQDASQSYGVAPRATQPGDPTYQGHVPSSYGSGAQQYPYGSNAPSQPAPPYNQSYGPASVAMDGYTQPPAAAYAQQQSGQAAAPAGYTQTGQSMPGYAAHQATSQQPATGYGQYAVPQQGYGEPASSSVAYGNPIAGSGYAAPPPPAAAGGSQSSYSASDPTGYY